VAEHDLTTALAERVRVAIERAHAVVAEADVLSALSRLLREPTSMAKRCAWCGRLALGRGWIPAEQIPAEIRALLEERMTHGICADCLRRLEREGKTRAIGARAAAPPASTGESGSSTSRDRRR
jgi:ribosomal protein L28